MDVFVCVTNLFFIHFLFNFYQINPSVSELFPVHAEVMLLPGL